MADELFNSYVGEFKVYRNKTKKLLREFKNVGFGSRKKEVQNFLKKKFDQMESILNNMEHEGYRNGKLLEKQKDLKDVFLEMKNEFNRLSSTRSAKDELVFYDETEDLEYDHKSRLVKSTETAENQEDTIRKSLLALDRIDERADSSLKHLVDQRGQIIKVIDNVQDIHAEGVSGARVISRMRRRQILNKIVFFCVILVLLLGIILVLFFGVIKPFILDKLPSFSSDDKNTKKNN